MGFRKHIICAATAMRCHQWVKNLFVFAAPLFGKQLLEPANLASTLVTFAAFCLGSSAVYLLNDLVDLNEDRQHPIKKKRPLASGKISISYAITAMLSLSIASLAISALFVSTLTAGILAIYMISNVLYSKLLKHIVILDVMFIAVGFVLRILSGASATGVTPSFWLLLCTMNISLFLGFAKRRAELVVLGNDAVNHRSVLQNYSKTFLDQMIAIVTSSTVVCYILYVMDPRTVEFFGSPMLVATVPFVMYGLFRYLFMAYHKEEGGSPTKAMLMDKAFLLNIFLWGLISMLIIYAHDDIEAWLSR